MSRPFLLNNSFASAVGRPDLVYAASRATVGQPPTVVVGGSAQTYQNSGATGAGQFPIFGLMALIVAYAGFTYWVKPHLA